MLPAVASARRTLSYPVLESGDRLPLLVIDFGAVFRRSGSASSKRTLDRARLYNNVPFRITSATVK